MFYTSNFSSLLVIKKGFMLIIILSYDQKCPLSLNEQNLVFLLIPSMVLLKARKMNHFADSMHIVFTAMVDS